MEPLPFVMSSNNYCRLNRSFTERCWIGFGKRPGSHIWENCINMYNNATRTKKNKVILYNTQMYFFLGAQNAAQYASEKPWHSTK